MTQEEKELLFKDLCARLPYGVKILANTHKGEKIGKLITITSKFFKPNDKSSVILGEVCTENECFWLDSGLFKPYLRTISSITDEEFQNLEIISNFDVENIRENGSFSLIEFAKIEDFDIVDWINKHHFDYRGLIEKGLALEAPKDMYNTKN